MVTIYIYINNNLDQNVLYSSNKKIILIFTSFLNYIIIFERFTVHVRFFYLGCN